MGYVFYTLKGAAIFVSSVHIYNGLGLITQFMTFPIVYSATTVIEKGVVVPEIQMYEYLPGFIYSVIYLATGIFIFKGIESESSRMIKLPTLIFSATQVIFFVLRGMVGVFPIPILMADLSQSEKPSQWNVYKTIHFLTLTLLGGAVYLFVLFLYLQQLAGPNSNIMDVICISSRKRNKNPPPIECTAVIVKESESTVSNMEPSYSSPHKKPVGHMQHSQQHLQHPQHQQHQQHQQQQHQHHHSRSISQRRAHEYSAQGQYQGQPVYHQQPPQNVYAQAFDRPPPPRY